MIINPQLDSFFACRFHKCGPYCVVQGSRSLTADLDPDPMCAPIDALETMYRPCVFGSHSYLARPRFYILLSFKL